MSKPRKIEVGANYHIYSRGVNKCDTYLEEIDYYRFMDLIKACNMRERINLRDFLKSRRKKPKEELVTIVTYCLMPNHFHMILQEKQQGGLSLFLQKLLTGYSIYFNKKYKRTGALFGSRFKDKFIGDDLYFNHLCIYIQNNPIKILNPHYKSEHVLNGSMILTLQEKEFAKNYPYKYLAPT